MSVPATKTAFDLPVLASPQESLEIMRMNLEGTSPKFERVKIPAGGGLVFEVPGEEGPGLFQEIVGIIIDHYPVNAYWSDKYSGQNNPPDCSALDGKVGITKDGQQRPCNSCPMNAWGSDEEGRGKACKNMHRLYILREGESLPILLTLPPTSLGNFYQYMTRLASKLKPYFGVVTKVKLQKATNKDGITYSQAVFVKVADLSREEAAVVREYANGLRHAMRAVAIEQAEAAEVESDTPDTEPF